MIGLAFPFNPPNCRDGRRCFPYIYYLCGRIATVTHEVLEKLLISWPLNQLIKLIELLELVTKLIKLNSDWYEYLTRSDRHEEDTTLNFVNIVTLHQFL
jgi:hypothetical protein